MRKLSFCTILFTVAMFLASAMPTAAAPHYTCKKIPPLNGQQVFSGGPTAINNAGQVTGGTIPSSSSINLHAFLYSGGVTQDLGTLPAYNYACWGESINASGQVVGYSEDSQSHYRAFLWSPPGVMQDLGTLLAPVGASSWAQGINDAGQVVGYSDTMTYHHAFLYSGGVMQDLGTPTGASISAAYGINNNGQVVGEAYTLTGDWMAFLYSDGAWQGLGTLGGRASTAYAINDKGWVVGDATTSPTTSQGTHAFLFINHVMQDLGTLGGDYSTARSINNAGQVVGWSSTSSGNHAFLYLQNNIMWDLNNLVQNLPKGEVLVKAVGINNQGQIAVGGIAACYVLSPIRSPAAYDLLLLQ